MNTMQNDHGDNETTPTKPRKRWPFVLLGILLVLAIPLLGLFWLSLTWDPQNVNRGSLSYRFGIPDVMKAVPLLKPCSDPLYSHTGRDGERAAFHSVVYGSSASTDEIAEHHLDWLQEAGCEFQSGDLSMSFGPCSDMPQVSSGLVEIADAEKSCRRVTVEIIGD